MPPTLQQPGIDYVRAYQGLYGVTLRLATEYASLPPGDGGGGLNGNSQATAYGQALKDVCADNNDAGGDSNCIGKCAILQDIGTMSVPGTDYFLPGSLYGALVQINDTAGASTWAQNEVTKLIALVTLFGWTYIGPNPPSTSTDFTVDVGSTDFYNSDFNTFGSVFTCFTTGARISITGGNNYGNIGQFVFTTANFLNNQVVTMNGMTENVDFTVIQNDTTITITEIGGSPLSFPILIQGTTVVGVCTEITIGGSYFIGP